MQKEDVLFKIKHCGLVAVVRAESAESAMRIAQACADGGVAAVEITFTVPSAEAIIRELSASFDSEKLLVGAGTVLDPQTARIAMLAGAQYIVSPSLNVETVKLCNRYRVPCMPGAATLREVIECMEAGADIVKLFPGEMFGPAMVKAIRGPLPHAQIMPTGGVSLDNVQEWIRAGAVALGVGGNLTAGAKTGDYASITRMAAALIGAIRTVRTEGGA